MSASLLVIWEIKQFQNGLVKECSLCESQAETGRTMHSSIVAISHALGFMCKKGMVLLTAAVHYASAPHLHCSSPALTLCRPYGVGHLAAELRTVNEEACRYMCRHHHNDAERIYICKAMLPTSWTAATEASTCGHV